MANAIQRFLTPYIRAVWRSENKAPGHIRAEVTSTNEFNYAEYLNGLTDEQRYRIAMSVGWVAADIDLISKKVSSSPLKVKKITNEKKTDIKNHDFEKLWRKPNEFMNSSFLLHHLITAITTSRSGAFLYLSPDRSNGNKIVEIWPINPSQMEPEKDRLNYIKHFWYTPDNGGVKYKIPAQYVVWFRYPDLDDYWASKPPLDALMNAISIELGMNESQKKFYTKSRGAPLSIISVDPDMSDPLYAQFKSDIRREWSSDNNTFTIARGGTLDVETLGYTSKELEILGNQELTRDKIDSVLLGIPFRRDTGGSNALKDSDTFINNSIIFPLHMLISEQLTISATRFWGNDISIEFDDIRDRDRSLNMQEDNINSRWRTINEMRESQGFPPLDDDEIGDLLVPLATNPSYVSQVKGLTIDNSKVETPDEVGNLPEARDAQAVTNQLARGNTSPQQAVEAMKLAEARESFETMQHELIRADLKRWRVVAKRSFTKGVEREFVTTVIPSMVKKAINMEIESAKTVDEIDELFRGYIEQYNR